MNLHVDPMLPVMVDQPAGTEGAQAMAQAAALGRAEALLTRGEVSECVAVLRTLRPKPGSGRMRDRYNYLTLATAIFGADTQNEAAETIFSEEVFASPALGYRYALQSRHAGRAKEIRRANPRLHSEFGWSASLRCLWDGKLGQGLKLYPHRHRAVNFGSFVPEGAIYRALDPHSIDADGAMFIEQGVGDALLHLALMTTVRPTPPRLIVGPPQFKRFVERFFPDAEFRRNGVPYEDLRGRLMHASGDYLALAHQQMGGFKPKAFVDAPQSALFPRFGVCWRGGSAQNRREQRRYDLDHFLDLLPVGPSYVALQPDLREDEERVLQQSGRVQTPDFDIRSDIDALITLVSRLAGVISVDSANLHLAGLARTPAFALMNAKSHWYWGPRGEVGDVYEGAVTTPRHQATTDGLKNWINRCEADFPSGPPAVTTQSNTARPVFITGIPRSGTSMISNCLHEAGLWMGATIRANRDNPRGFFENRDIRENILKPSLSRVGADPLGVRRLPDLRRLAPDPALRDRVSEIISRQGHDGQSPWGYKEPKLSLCWPVWIEAFPDATWVIVDREDEAVVASCLNTGFMNRHSRDAEFWRTFTSRYRERLRKLEDVAPDVVRISADAVAGGDLDPLKGLVKRLDLDWTPACEAQIAPALFNRAHRTDRGAERVR